MANPEKRSFLNRITKGRFGKVPGAGEKSALSGAVAPIRLTDQGKTLAATLSAYDAQQVKMTAEEKKAQNQRVVSGQEDIVVSDGELQRRRAGVQISQDLGVNMDEAMKRVESFEAASREIPGIKGMLRMLAEKKGKEEK